MWASGLGWTWWGDAVMWRVRDPVQAGPMRSESLDLDHRHCFPKILQPKIGSWPTEKTVNPHPDTQNRNQSLERTTYNYYLTLNMIVLIFIEISSLLPEHLTV